MKTRAVRLYGADDIRLDEFELPEIKEDEILVRVVSDSICMSTYKLLKQGTGHKRCPKDVAENPIIIGHEPQKFILESQTELLEVEMGKCLYCIGPWIVHDLRDQCVDMRIPFQVPAKGVKACDHPELS